MPVEPLIRQYVSQAKIMQLATAANGQPWACTVHYYADTDLSLYWISTPERKHSKDIDQNKNVAAAILVHENTADEPYIIGISIAETAEIIHDQIDERIGQAYIQKTERNPQFLDDIASGKNPHRFYRLKPTSIVLFDTQNFPESPRQELIMP